MHFRQQRTLHPDQDLKIHGSSIPEIEDIEFLGLNFDKKLTFVPHIRYPRDVLWHTRIGR